MTNGTVENPEYPISVGNKNFIVFAINDTDFQVNEYKHALVQIESLLELME